MIGEPGTEDRSAVGVVPADQVRRSRWQALGTWVELLSTAAADDHDSAEQLMRTELDAADRTASRFRADSELSALNRQAGRWTAVSAELYAIIDACVAVARDTDGLVAPVLGRELAELGYDRDFP